MTSPGSSVLRVRAQLVAAGLLVSIAAAGCVSPSTARGEAGITEPTTDAAPSDSTASNSTASNSTASDATASDATASGSQNSEPKTPGTTVALTGDLAIVAPYAKQADDICHAARVKMAANLGAFEVHKSVSGNARRKTVKLAKPAEVEAYVRGQISQLDDQQKQVRKLTLPAGAPGKQIADLWTQAEAVITKVKADPQAAAYTDPFRPVAKELAALGFHECFQPARPASA